jgi:DNA-binding helix-hairpin-helix protein with protein kinase domain
MSTYRSTTGRIVKLGRQIGAGAEGAVYEVEGNSAEAAKIYLNGAPRRSAKITEMVRANLYNASKTTSFPNDILLDARGQLSGFLMRRVTPAHPAFDLYAPGSRKKNFPAANFAFLVRAAGNLARAVAEVHHLGCVIGDINPSGVLVNDKAIVYLIDADSFQFPGRTELFKCNVGVAEYTPPELQGCNLSSHERDQLHDAFGLAVLIFQFLAMGRHPYAGRFLQSGDMPISRAITESRFVYTRTRHRAVAMEPPPYAPSLEDFGAEIASLFELAFSLPASRHLRPDPATWAKALGSLERELVACVANPSHHVRRGTTACPWCRLEIASGNSLFLRPSRERARVGGSTSKSPFCIDSFIASLERVPTPGPAPEPLGLMRPVAGLNPSPAAQAAHDARTYRHALAFVAGAGGVAALAAGIQVGVLGLVVAAVAFGSARTSLDALGTAAVAAEVTWRAAATQWQDLFGDRPFLDLKTQLRKLADEYRGLNAELVTRLQALDGERQKHQLHAYLQRHRLANADIDGIKEGRKATLLSFGIESAADISRREILRIPGFGEVLCSKLLRWRQSLEACFRFDPSAPVDPQLARGAHDAIAAHRERLELEMSSGAASLQALADGIQRGRIEPSPNLVIAYTRLLQARVDLSGHPLTP